MLVSFFLSSIVVEARLNETTSIDLPIRTCCLLRVYWICCTVGKLMFSLWFKMPVRRKPISVACKAVNSEQGVFQKSPRLSNNSFVPPLRREKKTSVLLQYDQSGIPKTSGHFKGITLVSQKVPPLVESQILARNQSLVEFYNTPRWG